MRTGVTVGPRPQYYDRNPTNKSQVYATTGVAPAGSTTRWTYTVPTGKKAFLDVFYCQLIRDAVATTAGVAHAYLQYVPSGAGAVFLADNFVLTNALGDRQTVNGTSGGALLVGDAISAITSDTSTGGTFAYSMSAKAVEYDA